MSEQTVKGIWGVPGQGMHLSPYGMDKCCICDSPEVVYAIPNGRELLPYCKDHAEAVHEAFPTDPLYLYTPRRNS